MSKLPRWTPFEKAILLPQPPGYAAHLAREHNITLERAEEIIADARRDIVFKNSRYQVSKRVYEPSNPDGFGIVHLSIKRIDKQPPGPERWRDFQRIKNELVGPDYEGFELYPAEDRLVDTANQYHLWVVNMAGFHFPFGFNERLVMGPSPGPHLQQPFEDDEE